MFIFLDRYYLFYTTNTVGSPVNDHAVVYDYNKKWGLFDDIPAYSATLYLNQLYLGDSGATGTIYQMDSGYDDSGTPFTMEFKTPDLDMGNSAEIKQFDRVYLQISAPNSNPANTSISCTYTLDGSTIPYSLGTVALSEATEQYGYFNAKLPFPSGQAGRGHWISLDCSYSGANGPVNVYGLKVVYKPLNWE